MNLKNFLLIGMVLGMFALGGCSDTKKDEPVKEEAAKVEETVKEEAAKVEEAVKEEAAKVEEAVKPEEAAKTE